MFPRGKSGSPVAGAVDRRAIVWSRLTLRVGVVAAFAVVFAVSSFYGRRTDRMLERVQSGYFPSVQMGGELKMLLTQIQHGLLDAAESSDPEALREVDQTYEAFLRTLERASRSPVADQERYAHLRRAVERYYRLARATTGRMIAGESFAAVAPSLEVMQVRQNAAVALVDEMRHRDDAAIRAAFVTSRTTQRTNMTVMGGVILLCTIALLIGSLLGDRLQESTRRNEDLQRNREELEREVSRRTQELAELGRRNLMILDAAAEGICGLDRDASVTFINRAAAAMIGLEAEAILGRRLHDVLACARTSDTEDESCILCSDIAAAPDRVDQVTEVRTRNGATIPVEYTASAILDDQGAATGQVITFRDISARRAVEKMKDEFVSTVNHELRTPLTSIRGALGLLNSGRIGQVGERGQRMLTIAVQNTDRLIRLINDILDLDRIRSGRIGLERAPVAAGALMQTVVDGVQTLADQAGIRLEVEPAAATLWVDNDRIVQTLTNLVSNAIKFSPAGTAVTIGGVEKDGEFQFHVSDRGRGIPEDRLESIFERFQQVDASDSRDKGGSGLGLAICRSIVDAHGGRIWAERREGGGSTFRFTLPARPRLGVAARPTRALLAS